MDEKSSQPCMTSLGECMRARITLANPFYLGIDDFGYKSKSSNKVEWTGALYSCLHAFIHWRHARPAGYFIHLCHKAALACLRTASPKSTKHTTKIYAHLSVLPYKTTFLIVIIIRIMFKMLSASFLLSYLLGVRQRWKASHDRRRRIVWRTCPGE